MQKPTWVVEKERNKRMIAAETFWIFGIHAVRDALLNSPFSFFSEISGIKKSNALRIKILPFNVLGVFI